MIFDATEIRRIQKKTLLCQGIDPSLIDKKYNLFFDETNNIKKFLIREDGTLNVPAETIFVLGGIEGDNSLGFNKIKRLLSIQSSAQEIKAKHIYKGSFSDCLRSNKLETYLDLVLENGWHVHFQSLNLLYWSIVDIIDSIDSINNSLSGRNAIKSIFYEILKREIDRTANIMFKYEYPNVKDSESIQLFMNELIDICSTCKFSNVTEELLRIELVHHLNNGAIQKVAYFIQDELPLKLIKDLTHFYQQKIYTWQNSCLIFDKEADIEDALSNTTIILEGQKLCNYSFIKSHEEPMIQMSDIAVGIVAKYLQIIDQLDTDFSIEIDAYDTKQKRIFKKLNNWLLTSREFNPVFFHQVTSIKKHDLLNFYVENYQ